jgi:hypothetical protein
MFILLRPPLWSSGHSSWLHNGYVLCFLWGTNWIYLYIYICYVEESGRSVGIVRSRTQTMEFVCYVEESRPPLWSSGQSSWLQNGDVLCFLWRTNWICIRYVEERRPPLWSSGQSSWLHNGDVLCFLWSTNWIYIWYVEERRPPLWSSGQSSWLQNGDVLFPVRYELNLCYVEERRPPLWSSGQSSWPTRVGKLSRVYSN